MGHTETTKTPIWTKSFNINFLTNFLVYLSMYLLIVLIASYTTTTYNASASIAGLVTGLFIIGSLIGRFTTGKYVNQLGPKKILICGLIFLIITQLCYFIEGSLLFLMFTRLINGIATGIITTATGTIAAYVTPPERKSEGISMFSLSLVIGTAIGPFFGLFLSNIYPIEVLFGLCLACGIISLITSLFIKVQFETTSKEQHSSLEKSKGFDLSNYLAKEAVPVAILMVLSGLTYSSILSFIKDYAEEINLVTVSSYFFIFYALSSLFTRPLAGRLMDNRNENVVAYPSFIFLILTFVCLYFTSSSWLMVVAGLCLGAGYGTISSIMQAVAIKVSPPAKYGVATSTYFIGLDLGIGLGPYLLGFLINSLSYASLYGLMAIVALITMVLYYLFHGRKVKESY
ncbi:MFS transporter [Staphylococcus sp. SQ8-PEA]|uniref:MFS transporter n=1 Tax=Staphylococcus marylandisciuri TaxID=2981529 RepID=A0ABT2QMG7_9STAP|nr:MFS transporter [Staphylococcus marylandisciuri]MCU5745174.1 MFS transporter [Staphylococcus marylandisciuri]